jgi:Ca2+:H+ antiporter
MPSLRRAASVPWTTAVPSIGIAVLVVTWSRHPPAVVLAGVAVILVGSVFAAVHHAEVVAHWLGEPLGSLVLAISVTVIEVALIVALMASDPAGTQSLARDTVFAVVMITCNGIVGMSLLVGSIRLGTAPFNAEGTSAALATVATLTTLSLVLPTFTTTKSGPEFSPAQLAFAAVASVSLYALFLFVQTVRHKDFFVPVGEVDDAEGSVASDAASDGSADDVDETFDKPSTREALVSTGLLLVALVAVVGLAKVETPAIEDVVSGIGAPPSAVGVVIALLVLLPEILAALRHASAGRIQTSLNMAFGSAMASIGLTIPAIAIATIWLEGPLVLGLGSQQIVLLALTVPVAALTVLTGRATLQESGVHLALFGAFLFFALVP